MKTGQRQQRAGTTIGLRKAGQRWEKKQYAEQEVANHQKKGSSSH
jgi:hypothetical protein